MTSICLPLLPPTLLQKLRNIAMNWLGYWTTVSVSGFLENS